jgi:hypothetical protein
VNWPLAESVRAVAPLLPRRLFRRDATRELESIAGAVGGTMEVFGFECRLGCDATRVDLGARHAVPTASRRHGSVACRRLTSFPARLRKLVSFVFSEWDVVKHGTDVVPRVPVPSVFLGLAPSGTSTAAHLADVKRLLHDLMGRRGFASCDQTLTRCFEALPARGRIRVVGAMTGRSPQKARLSVSLPRKHLAGYLAQLGLGRCGRTAARVARNLSPQSVGALIDFDVRSEIGPTIGIHFRSSDEIHLLLDWLVDAGLCTVDKRQAVLAWERVVTLRLRRDGWLCRLYWYFDHIKVVCGPDGPLEAKVYLGIAPSLCFVR